MASISRAAAVFYVPGTVSLVQLLTIAASASKDTISLRGSACPATNVVSPVPLQPQRVSVVTLATF